MNVILLGYLLINVWTDWKRKEINMLYTILFIAISIVYKQEVHGMYYWSGMIPGLILIVISIIWRQHIGLGDGVIVMAFGWMCGLILVCEVLMGGFLLAAGTGMIYCVKEKRLNVELPFVPFFLGSYLLEVWI